MNDNDRVNVADRIAPRVNRYYLKVSRQCMIAGIALLVVFVSYVVFVASFFGEYITYDNLRYLVRDWNAMTVPGNQEFTDIVYTAARNTRFTTFRNGLALYDSEKYSYYDESGICLIEDDTGYADPASSSSARYLLLYDIGGTGYSLYNQLTKIISRNTDRAIITGDVADDGTMVLVTRSRETKFVAEVYNSAFTKIMNIYKENYVLDAAISPDGNTVIICSAVPAETDFNLEVEILRTGSSERTARMTYEHTMPLDIRAYENGFVLLCDNGLYFFDYEGHINQSTAFDGMTLASADIGDSTVAVAGQVNALGSENRIIVCSLDGTVLYDQTIEERISGITASVNPDDALAYTRTANSITKILPDKTAEVHHPESGEIIAVIARQKGALVCRESGAYIWVGNESDE